MQKGEIQRIAHIQICAECGKRIFSVASVERLTTENMVFRHPKCDKEKAEGDSGIPETTARRRGRGESCKIPKCR